jgi:hypothetical protein
LAACFVSIQSNRDWIWAPKMPLGEQDNVVKAFPLDRTGGARNRNTQMFATVPAQIM